MSALQYARWSRWSQCWKPCLIGDTAIWGPLATRGRLLRHLRPDFRRDTGATHQFMPLQPMGGGGRTTHRINVITAKSFRKKSPAKWTKIPGLQLGREAARCICIKQELMTKAVPSQQRVDRAADMPLHLRSMIYLKINVGAKKCKHCPFCRGCQPTGGAECVD